METEERLIDALMDLLIEIEREKIFCVGCCIMARDYGIVGETIEYIKSHPGIGTQEVYDFVMYEDYDGERKIDREVIDDDD